MRHVCSSILLALAFTGCAARGAQAPSPSSPAFVPIDAPAGDAEATCARSPVSAETSTFFSSVSIESADSVDVAASGDLWPSCTSGDVVFMAWGDGYGFTQDHKGKRPDIGVASLTGEPWTSIQGTNRTQDRGAIQAVFRVWSKGPYYQKPTGMLCAGRRIYMAVQDLDGPTYDDVPAATIAASDDEGKTWTEGNAPMFTGAVFTTIMFLDFGTGPDPAAGSYVYAYGLDHNWRASTHVLDPQGLYLARIPAQEDLLDRRNWEFYAGPDAAGVPTWSRDITEKRAVLVDCTRRHVGDTKDSPKGYSVISQGGVVYDAPLHRYIYTSWTEYTFEFYEAPAPWGPWRRFLSKDFGLPPWTAANHGGYGTSIPSRYISKDGTTMWVQSNTWSAGVDHNNLALRKLVVQP